MNVTRMLETLIENMVTDKALYENFANQRESTSRAKVGSSGHGVMVTK